MRNLTLAALAALTVPVATAHAQWDADKAKKNIVEVASAAGQFNTLLAAAKAAGLAETLSSKGPFTVFAPTDAAFEKLGNTVNELLKPENKDKLKTILLYHVVPGRMPAEKVIEENFLETAAAGQAIQIKADQGGAMADGANIVKTDIMASNGIIHVIDAVILPKDSTIVSVAASNEDFSTLVAAVKAAGLVDTLNGGPFTVFAPTNAAFKKLGSTVNELLKPENKDKLTAILTYHVVPGRLLAEDVLSQNFLSSAQGAGIRVSQSGDGAKVDGANIVKTDIVVGNGVIHVIDSVITPRPSIVETAAGNEDFSTLVAAVQAAGLAEALSGKGPFTVFAPNNAAFEKLPDGTVDSLLENPSKLASILKFHVIPGRVLSGDLPQGEKVEPKTLMGQSLNVMANDKGVTVNGAKVIAADILCGNGVIHVIDSVVLPK